MRIADIHPYRWLPKAALGALIFGAGLASAAQAATKNTGQVKTPVRQTDATKPSEAAKNNSAADKVASDMQFLNGYDIVIGDYGDHYGGWEDSQTRVHAVVRTRHREYDHYFDSLPAAYFVLNETYGDPLIVDLEVPEYAGIRHEEHGHAGHGLIDALDAWYVWDYDHYSRGGMPLILAFSSRRDARDELRYRDGELMDFRELNYALERWNDDCRRDNRVYWRGWDRDRWDDSNWLKDNWDNQINGSYHSGDDRWDIAWKGRWQGWDWDDINGWLHVDVNVGDDNRGRWDRDDRRRWDRDDNRGRHRDRDRGRGRGRYRH